MRDCTPCYYKLRYTYVQLVITWVVNDFDKLYNIPVLQTSHNRNFGIHTLKGIGALYTSSGNLVLLYLSQSRLAVHFHGLFIVLERE